MPFKGHLQLFHWLHPVESMMPGELKMKKGTLQSFGMSNENLSIKHTVFLQ